MDSLGFDILLSFLNALELKSSQQTTEVATSFHASVGIEFPGFCSVISN